MKPEAKKEGKNLQIGPTENCPLTKDSINKYEIQKADQEKIFAAHINRQRLTIHNPLNPEKDSLIKWTENINRQLIEQTNTK